MDENLNNVQDDNQDRTLNEESEVKEGNSSESGYSDPNAGYYYGQPNNQGSQPNQQNQYQQYQQYQQYSQPYNQQQYQQQNQNWGQDNYNYNVGSNMGYNNASYDSGMDNTPLTMGDWVLTILALMIPCAGIILYFVWAFGKNGNINRRNYCRAYLIIWGISVVLGIILVSIFGVAIVNSIEYGMY